VTRGFLRRLCLAALLGTPGLLRAQVRMGGELRVPRTATVPVIDGRLDDEAWRDAAVLDQWVQTKPGDNIAPAGRTTAYLTYDHDAIYIGVRAWDDRSKVRYRLHERDAIVEQGQDWIGLELDTFNDRRRAFGFAVNPLGVQGDGVNVEGTGFTEWDGEFDSVGKLLDDGWSIEIRIPFRTLRYPAGAEPRWGLSLARHYGRDNMEDSPWPRDRNLSCTLCQMITITGLQEIATSRAVEFNPTLVARTNIARSDLGQPFGPRENGVDVGANLKVGLTPGLTFDGTVNPDFSQVEADAGQLTLNNRFALFYPEKRPFFLEGADVFETKFPIPGADVGFQPAPVNLVYTRRIADPVGGLKLSGKEGTTGLGTIAALDDYRGYTLPDSLGGVPAAALDPYDGNRVASGVARGKLDVLSDGFVGATGTWRSFGDGWNWVGSVDSRLRFGPNWSMRILAAASGTQEQDFVTPAWQTLLQSTGDSTKAQAAFDSLPAEVQDLNGEARQGAALQAQGEYKGRYWQFGAGYLDITPGFDTQLGFTPRTDQILFSSFVKYTYRGTGFFKEVTPSARVEQGYEHAEDRLASFGKHTDFLARGELDLLLPGATNIAMGYGRQFIRFEEIDFDNLDRVFFWVESRPLTQLSAFFFVRAGEEVIYYDQVDEGDPLPNFFISAQASLGVRPVPPLRIDFSLSAQRIWRRTATQERESLYGESAIPRIVLRAQATRRLGLRVIGEYRYQRFYERTGALADRFEQMSLDVLASYVIHPNQSIQVRWSQAGEGDLITPRQWTSRGALTKFSYVWHF